MKKLLLSSFLILVFNFLTAQVANGPQVLEVCDDNYDGFVQFDLSSIDQSILGGQDPASYTIAYFASQADADSATNPLTSNYTNTSNPQTIYARVTDISNGNFDTTLVTLRVLPLPSPNPNIPTLEVCDDNSDGFSVFDLTVNESLILNGELDVVISYYETSLDAAFDINPILSPQNYTNTTAFGQTIFARVENLVTGCYTVVDFDIVVNSIPQFDLGDYTICGGDNVVLDTNLDSSQYGFAWFFNGGVVVGGTSPSIIVNEAGTYTVTVIDYLGCAVTSTSVISDGEGPVGPISNLTVCDEDEDGFASFDLTSKDDEILEFIPNATISYHETLLDADSGTNALSSPYNNTSASTQTIYVRVDSGSCYTTSSFDIEASVDECADDANIIVDTTLFTVQELVEDVLFSSECTSVSNISFSTGSSFSSDEPNGIGYFSYSGSNFPFSEGILISNGSALDAAGPNTTSNLTGGSFGWPGDSDLDQFTNINSFNATYIEFDFVSTANAISFEFLMASEEYNQGAFECQFSDAFAFLLTDEQGNTINLAVLPGTQTPILVTNVHPENPSCGAINEEYFGEYIPVGSPPIAYDGRTAVFTALAPVNIGETYHIKLVVADDTDSILDSAVFLKANSFEVGGLCNDVGLINVRAFNDNNDNGILDAGEPDFTNGNFTYEKNNDGIINYVSTSLGNFSIISEDENDTYDITFDIFDEYSGCYTTVTNTFENVSAPNGDVVTVNFPMTDVQVCEDLAVYLLNPFDAPRPGFTHENLLIFENLSSSTITAGTIEFTFDSQLEFNGITAINPNYTVTTSSTGFTVDFVNLEPGAIETVQIELLCPVGTALETVVTNTANYVTDSNDIISDNNSSQLSEIVIGSYDPNDKMEGHGPEILFADFGSSDEYLYYTIRFQNVGTAEAIFVRIEDELDIQLDETTFQMLRSSHDYTVTRTDTSLEWFFDDINLPAEQDDAEGSNGYVHFRIKPKPGYAIGDIISNNASIYFDFNAPIITNTFTSTFVESLSISDFEKIGVKMYPNPANDLVYFQRNDFSTDMTLKVYDIHGKVIYSNLERINNSLSLDVSNWINGVYFVEINNGSGQYVEKLIIN